MTPGEVMALAAVGGLGGTGLGGLAVRYLLNKYLRDLEKFQVDTVASLAKASQAVTDLRAESEKAREVLRQHVDHQDSIIRERNHTMAGDMGILTNKVAVAERNIAEVETTTKEILDEIHKLDKTISILTVAINGGAYQHNRHGDK